MPVLKRHIFHLRKLCRYGTLAVMQLDDWMKENGLSDEQLAERVGSARTTISRIRRGKRRPSWNLAARLKEVTGGKVTLDDLSAAA